MNSTSPPGLWILALSLFVVPWDFLALSAQEAAAPAEDTTAPVATSVVDSSAANGNQSRRALASVLESIKRVDQDLAEARSRLQSATELEKADLEADIKVLQGRRESLRTDFESIATGVDPVDYEGSLSREFQLRDELDALLEPIIGELKALTEKPREIEQLRSELLDWEQRLATTQEALTNLDSLLQTELPEEVRLALGSTRKTWEESGKSATNRIQAISYQLEQAENNQPSLLDTVRSGLRSFYRSRGRNFVLCLLAFFATFFLLRFLHQQLDRYFPWNRRKLRPFYIRLIDVGLNLFSVVGATIAAILTLYATGDWVLMGIAIIVLLGVTLAAKNALPRFYEQGRLLLNLGEVREGERILYNGIPWKVERLSFYTIFRNEELRGGMIRLPVTHLSGLVSRPTSEEGEIWFPCREGDWVLLPDEGHGRVILQSPESVQIVKLGGAKITMPTIEFLSKSPMNLSPGFRVSTTFGVDYQHQAISTTTIPEKMWAFITKELYQLVGDRENLQSLKVELASAGASSLDYAIIADFEGCMAAKYQVISRALQRFAVECCNENGWVIPFTQITLHNAYPSPAPPAPAEQADPSKLP